jgi:hypothetical protein
LKGKIYMWFYLTRISYTWAAPEDSGLKPGRANSLQDPISKKKLQKRTGGVAQDIGPEFKPQYCKKK